MPNATSASEARLARGVGGALGTARRRRRGKRGQIGAVGDRGDASSARLRGAINSTARLQSDSPRPVLASRGHAGRPRVTVRRSPSKPHSQLVPVPVRSEVQQSVFGDREGRSAAGTAARSGSNRGRSGHPHGAPSGRKMAATVTNT